MQTENIKKWWKKVLFSEISQLNKKSLSKNFLYSEIEYIDISSVWTGELLWTTIIDLEKAPSRAKRLVVNWDIILSTVRPNRRSFYFIQNASPNTVVSTWFAVLTATTINNRYLYYIITLQSFTDYLTKLAKWATYPAIDAEIISNAEITIPESLETQQKIASILSKYDDLIENNTKRIQILEQTAQEVYKEWFVKFKFLEHESIAMIDSGTDFWMIPEGWEVKVLWTSTEIIKWISYKSTELSESDGMSFVNLKCFNRGGGFRIDGLKKYTGKYKEAQISYPWDIVMAVTDMTQNREVVARVALIPRIQDIESFTLSCDVIKIVPINIPKDYLYYVLRFSEFSNAYKSRANWANVLHLRPDEIKDFQFLKPDKEILDKFNSIIANFTKEIDVLNIRNANLKETRDLLLPRLISGEVDVENLDVKI